MLERYRLYRRNGEHYYIKDKTTGRAESLGTTDRTAAKQLLTAKTKPPPSPS